MEQDNIYVLNDLSEGVNMGIDAISDMMDNIAKTELKEELTKEYNEYNQILDMIRTELAKYNEIPKKQPMKDKVIGWTSVKMNMMVDKSDFHITKMLMEGVQMGIINGTKLKNHFQDINKDTKDILDKFIDLQESNMENLKQYL